MGSKRLLLSTLPGIMAGALLLSSVVISEQGCSSNAAPVTVQLLAINDFHGNLEPPVGGNGRIGETPAGGAEYLATHLKRAIAEKPNSIVVAAGDLVSASPLVSRLFHDEPAVEALNAMSLTVASVGNHEFDRGWEELLRLQKGGCHPKDGCPGGEEFRGAAFQYLSANVVRTEGQVSTPLFPATTVRTVGGVKIGFIGETLRGTPKLVPQAGVKDLVFLDEASTANRYATELKRQGVNAIVLLVHEGGEQAADPRPNACNDLKGDIIPIVTKLSSDIRVVASAHTHQFYNCEIAGHTVTSASSFGRMLTRITMTIAGASGAVIGVSAVNEVVTRDVPRDPAQSGLLAKYLPLSAPIAGRVVGSALADVTRTANAAGESALGDLVADAQLAATSGAATGGAVVAFVGSGGIGGDIVSNRPAGQPRPITYNDVLMIQPYSNVMTIVTMTGASLKKVLEQQFDNPYAGTQRILQVSNGFGYRYTLSHPPGQRVDPGSMKINGRVVSSNENVRVAVNNYLADGGDGFTLFKEGTDRFVGAGDVDALIEYIEAHSPLALPAQDRIEKSN